MTQAHMRKMKVGDFVSYVKVNWGAPFILLFFFLFAGAVFQEASFPTLNSNLAVISILTLALGIILQIVSFLKYQNASGRNIDE
jgi:ABC-type branched-subunit amino acid transport system permease subunit